jgi:hypothetical protein
VDQKKSRALRLGLPRCPQQNPDAVRGFDHDVLRGEIPPKSRTHHVAADGLQVASREEREGTEAR